MRVYYYLPKGIASVRGKPVYGYALGFPPTTISYKDYLGNKKALIAAPYDPEYLEQRIGPGAPDIRFTHYELEFMEYSTLRTLGKYVGVEDVLHLKRYILLKRIQLKLQDL